jgi:transposase-like protein
MVESVEQILKLIGQLDDKEREELRRRASRVMAGASRGLLTEPSPNQSDASKAERLLCPSCSSAKIRPYGSYRGRQRFSCRSCSRTFNELTQSPIAGTHHPEKWRDLVECLVAGLSVEQTASRLGISLPTAFRWRHKLLGKYKPASDLKLQGLVEADETFFLFSEKGTKDVSKRRAPRKRGGKAHKRGVSDEQVPVIVGCDRNGNVIVGVTGRGRISVADIENVLNAAMGSDVTLCTDAHPSFKAYAKAYTLHYVGVNISQGRRVVKKIYHIQNVNNFHARLKQWMRRFNGVSTKYLQHYMNWFALLEETKSRADSQAVAFAQRSVPTVLGGNSQQYI